MVNKLLIVGNGFDLYHGLPTRYTDFITFAENWETFKTEYDREAPAEKEFDVPLDGGKLTVDSIKEFAAHGGYNEDHLKELDENLKDNRWIKHIKLTFYYKSVQWDT